MSDMQTFENKLPESGPIKPYHVEVIADRSGTWAGNGVRFSTVTEAAAYARDLFMRWTAVREWRVVDADGVEQVRS